MRKLILGLVIATTQLLAQTLTISASPSSVRVGQTVSITVSCIGCATHPVSALQWAISTVGTAIACATGSAAVSAGKAASCSTTAVNPITVISGPNANLISDGVLLTATWQMPATWPSGQFLVALTGTLGASAAGDAVTVVAGSPFGLSVVSPCDINGDGAYDVADVSALMAGILNRNASMAMDLNSDGKVDVVDLQRVINAAMGQGCRVG